MSKQHGRLLTFGLIAALLIGASCGSSAQNTQNRMALETTLGSFSFTVELADTPQKRQMGLMGRTDLGAQEGMLFIFPSPSLNTFWMKDTPLSLDIIFISEGRSILQIAAQTEPFSEELIVPNQPYLFVLEVLAGTAAKIGLRVGDNVILPKL